MQNKPLVWSERAKKDIRKIKKFFDHRNKSDAYSKRLLTCFEKRAELIQTHPEATTLTDFENVRGAMASNHILYFEILEHHILVLTVWDARRDPNKLEFYLKNRNRLDV